MGMNTEEIIGKHCREIKEIRYVEGLKEPYLENDVLYHGEEKFDNAFAGMTSLVYADCRGISTDNLVEMFEDCWNLEEVVIPGWHGEDMSRMFNNCHRLKKITGLDMSEGVIMDEMFRGCTSLEEIRAHS